MQGSAQVLAAGLYLQLMDVRVRVVQTDDRMRVESLATVEDATPRPMPYLPLIAAIVIGLSLGYLWGAARSTAAIPVASSSALQSLVSATSDSDAPSPTTEPPSVFSISGTPSTSVVGLRLNDRVPGFVGSVTWQRPNGDVLKWRSGAVTAEILDLPDSARGQQWASRSARLVFIAGRNAVLYAGSGDFEPRAVGVASALWHATDMNRLAWLSESDLDGSQHLMVSSFADGQMYEAARVPTEGRSASVVGWNDSGFGVLLSDADGGSQLVVFDAAGTEHQRVDDLVVDGTKPDGSIVFRSNVESDQWWVMPLDGQVPAPLLGVPWRSPGGLAWSPDGGAFVAVDYYGLAWLVSEDGAARVISGEVVDVAWSAGSRFIVAADRLGRLVFYDLDTAVTTLVNVDEPLESLEAH